MAKPSLTEKLARDITRVVLEHPHDLTRFIAAKERITRAAAARYVLVLEKLGWIVRKGSSTRPVFSLGPNRSVSQTYPLKDLEEDLIWMHDFMPYLQLTPNVANIAAHGFTEMVNNAIDHSSGGSVSIVVTQTPKSLTMSIADDGVGIFDKIQNAFNLADKRQALFELSKGKLTTAPDQHSGEGVFFTSKMFDEFAISANGLHFGDDVDSSLDKLPKNQADLETGTRVFMRVALDSQLTTSQVFQQFMNAPEDFDFSKTLVPMKLARLSQEQLISRSQAKRLVARFDRFKTVTLDFEGIEEIGQAFADELFRVYRLAHPTIELEPIHMTRQIEQMWLRAVAPRMP